MCGDTLRTEVAPSVLIEVEEIFSPDLHEGLTVFRSIPRIDSMDSSLYSEVVYKIVVILTGL